MMRTLEITALLREAESRDSLAAALKSGDAAKELRKEREALERAAGGAKKLAAADKSLAKADDALDALKREGDAVVAEALKKAEAIVRETETGIADAKASIKRQKDLVVVRVADTMKMTDDLHQREAAVTEREGIVRAKEDDVAAQRSANESLSQRLAARQRELDSRDARIKAAVA